MCNENKIYSFIHLTPTIIKTSKIKELRALIAKLPTWTKENPLMWHNKLEVKHESGLYRVQTHLSKKSVAFDTYEDLASIIISNY